MGNYKNDLKCRNRKGFVDIDCRAEGDEHTTTVASKCTDMKDPLLCTVQYNLFLFRESHGDKDLFTKTGNRGN